MPNVISVNAAQADIERDVVLTVHHATAKGTPYQERAESFLRPALDNLAVLADRRKVTEAAYAPLLAQLTVEAAKCDALVLMTKDGLYNELGRPGQDPVFALWFPEGASTYTKDSPTSKGAALETLAGTLENTPHPLIAADRIQALAAELRAAAIAVDGLNALAGPVRTQLRVLQAQYRASVKVAHLQLSRLKKAWKSEGLSEVEIHKMIPDRPVASRAVAAAKGAVTVPVTTPAAAPVLTMVAPVEDLSDDEATDEVPAEEAAAK